MIVRSHTRSRPNRVSIIEKSEQLLHELWLVREWRALESAEYALPVLERDIWEAMSEPLDRIDMHDDWKQMQREIW